MPSPTPTPPAVDGCQSQPFRPTGAYYYSPIFNHDDVGWYNDPGTHKNAAFLTPYPVCAAVRVTSLRIPILAAAPQGCVIDVGLYSDVEINDNHYPKNLLASARIPGNVAGNVDIPVALDLTPAVYHIVWATNANFGCSSTPGIHGTSAWDLYIDSINANGRNEVVASYSGTGLWPVFPSGKGYGKGAFYLQLYYDQYLP